MTDHPIAPPPELVEQWLEQSLTSRELAAKAFQAGADQELEGCGWWLRSNWPGIPIEDLRAARRPKPSSLKEQALEELESIMDELHEATDSAFTASAIRRALEALDD